MTFKELFDLALQETRNDGQFGDQNSVHRHFGLILDRELKKIETDVPWDSIYTSYCKNCDRNYQIRGITNGVSNVVNWRNIGLLSYNIKCARGTMKNNGFYHSTSHYNYIIKSYDGIFFDGYSSDASNKLFEKEIIDVLNFLYEHNADVKRDNETIAAHNAAVNTVCNKNNDLMQAFANAFSEFKTLPMETKKLINEKLHNVCGGCFYEYN